MASLTALCVTLQLVAGSPVQTFSATRAVARWQAFIDEAANRFSIPEPWISRVMRIESAGMNKLDGTSIRSPKGAIGLMQLMPATWQDMRDRLLLRASPDDPHDNILAGAAYLRLLYDRFGYPGMFAAYNAGPGRYAAYRAGRSSLPRETRAYLQEVDLPPASSEMVQTPIQHAIFVVGNARKSWQANASAKTLFVIFKEPQVAQ